MRARSRVTRRLIVSLAAALIAACLTVACTTDEGSPAAPQPELEAEPTVVVDAEPSAVAVEEQGLEETAPPTVVPVATTAPAKPLPTPSAMRPVPPEPFFIGNTLGRGMSLRRAPTSADLVKAWPDGTVMEGLGAQQDARGWTWAWVRDPDGNDGWMPTQFLVRSPDEPSPALPLTPAPPEIPARNATPVQPTATPAAPPPAIGAPTVIPPGPSTTAAPAASGGSQVVAIVSNWYTSADKSTNAVGLVENKGAAPVVLEKIAISLSSESGNTVGVLNPMYAPRVLQPGEKAPWLVFGAQVPTYKEIRVQTDTAPFAGSDGERDYTRGFRVEGASVIPASSSRGSPKISGQVVNTGTRTTSSVKILVAVYGKDGSLTDVSQASVKLDAIGPGESAPFEATFRSGQPTITKHSVFVEGGF